MSFRQAIASIYSWIIERNPRPDERMATGYGFRDGSVSHLGRRHFYRKDRALFFTF